MNKILNNLRHSLAHGTTQLFFLPVVLFLTLCSCSKDEVATINQSKLLTKLVDVTASGSVSNTVFTYNGSKIVSIDTDSKHSLYRYTNDLITRVVTLDDTNQSQTILDYTYTDGLLVKVVSSDNYVMNFVHNDNGTISYERLTTDTNNNVIKIYSGMMFFQNGNLTRDERTINGTSATVVFKEIVSYQYDSKTNPLANIIGFSKLLDGFKSISVNNITRTQEETRTEYLGTDQVASTVVLYPSNNQYDEAGYPTVITSEKAFFGAQANHTKSQLFYN